MAVSIRRSFGPLKAIPLVTKADMEAVGRIARERIIRRTEAGQSSTGGAFEPYSAAYAERKAKELGSSSPNLQVSGEMLRSIQIEATDRSVTLFFSR